MKRLAPALLVGFALLISWVLAGQAFAQNAARKESPFEGLRWKGGTPEVLVGGDWFRPLSIDDVDVNAILDFCEARWPSQKEKRFGEDLVEAMTLMGHEPSAEVDLELENLEDGKLVLRQDVKMSTANRRAILQGKHAVPSASGRARVPAELSREQAASDLKELRRRLQDQFAYLEFGDFDWDAELKRIESSLSATVETRKLAQALVHVMARFRDGHARVSSVHLQRPELYPPFLLQEAEGGTVALLADRSSFFYPEHPYLLEIDGVDVETWIQRSSQSVPAGSPQLVRDRSLRDLRHLEFLREAKKSSPVLRVKLSAGAGSRPLEREFPMTEKRPDYGSWPRTESRILEGNFGYLRLESMDDERVPHLREMMTSFRKTEGLIVDVRGNGGGTRSLLIALAGYFIGPGEEPWIGNVAKYIESSQFAADHLDVRSMYRASDERWSDAQRKVIEAFAATFEPEWNPPGAFSEWHYLLLDRTADPAEYFYDKPVIVLSDAGCFSATDIFLGALSGRPRVTLMGEASSGGSARSMRFTLPNSQIRIRCASMASFRPDGRLYDGRGVEVDVKVPRQATDLLRGGTDSVLDAALQRLKR